MFFIKRIFIVSFLVVFCNTVVLAGGIEGSYGFGFAGGNYELDVDDIPGGTVDGTTYGSPIHLFYWAEMSSTSRLNIEFYHYDIKFDSKPNQTVGAQVLNSGMNFLYEEELKLSKYFKPTLGAGLQLSKLKQTSRHETDINGKLKGSEYPAKDDFAASLLVSVGYDFQVTDGMVFYTRLMQSLGVSNDLTETQFLFAFMFHN